jgi:phenylalanyl-tRNA synthetase beta chain
LLVLTPPDSKIIAGKTKNIFIDCTATDQTKLDIVVMLMATMFAEYCAVPFEIEPVKIHYPDGRTVITPNIAHRTTTASHSYLNAATGLDLSREEACKLLNKMSLIARPSTGDKDLIEVDVPCTRSDILHECDIMEDYAIGYGYNNLPTSLPTTSTVAKPFPINKLGDILRKECAMAGWIEALPYILCSHDENFAWLNRPDPGGLAIKLANPKSIEFQVVRTSVLPGLLKTVRENKALPLPLKVFEVSDVAVQDASRERKSRNFRRLGAVYVDRKAGFEVVHGLLDRIMQILAVPFIGSKESPAEFGYYIAETNEATYLPGRAANVYLRPRAPKPAAGLAGAASALKAALPGAPAARDIKLGTLGILHPTVLVNFELTRPASVLEIDVEPLL